MAAAKAPMLMKAAMSGVEAPSVKNDPGCWGAADDDDEVGKLKGTKVVVVEGPGEGGAVGFVSVDTVSMEAEGVTVSSPAGNNRLERGKEEEDDMAGGQGDGLDL
jgi:hypothetical protein